MTPDQLQYVVTGCAGSGTTWASVVLTRLGSPCGAEWLFDGHEWTVESGRWRRELVNRALPVSRPGFEGDSSWKAARYIASLSTPGVLLVRNPLDVVRSLDQLSVFLSDGAIRSGAHLATNCVLRRFPDVAAAADRLGRLLRYVATWDVNVARLHGIRILHVDRATPEHLAATYAHLTGRDIVVDRCSEVMSAVGPSVGTHGGPHSTVTWDDIHTHPDGGPVIERALTYGYPTSTRGVHA